MKSLKSYEIIARAVVRLFAPLVEVVIHDLATKKIVFIAGGLSKRVVGDDSLLGDSPMDWSTVDKDVYPKIGWDGRLIKAISLPLYDGDNIVALMCINADVSVFESMRQLSAEILERESAQPEVLFRVDWQERLHVFVHTYLKRHGLALNSLATKEKKKLVRALYDAGVFEEKNAADYVAEVLDMGRATIFNYLREWRCA